MLGVQDVVEELGICVHGSHVPGGKAEGGGVAGQFGGEVVYPDAFSGVVFGEVIGFWHRFGFLLGFRFIVLFGNWRVLMFFRQIAGFENVTMILRRVPMIEPCVATIESHDKMTAPRVGMIGSHGKNGCAVWPNG